MKKRWKKLIALVVVALVSSLFYFWYSHKSLRNIQGETGLVVSANELYNAYKINEDTANKKFNNKTLIVAGKVFKADNTEDANLLMLGDSGKVNCVFQKANWKKFATGEDVIIKGICSDYIDGTVSIRECTAQ